ncbi:uncharacterized protein LOC119941631 [Tachyglossus aculeatus]|uniref:uncharacterized protein LOC119941631 n=1 Tax=Tachyglossus aculeatus TaxID=9261 RepID=UPI0018F555B9|nr:uncharacterized protein LOC119941631 [Tachyglossus aculeatus]
MVSPSFALWCRPSPPRCPVAVRGGWGAVDPPGSPQPGLGLKEHTVALCGHPSRRAGAGIYYRLSTTRVHIQTSRVSHRPHGRAHLSRWRAGTSPVLSGCLSRAPSPGCRLTPTGDLLVPSGHGTPPEAPPTWAWCRPLPWSSKAGHAVDAEMGRRMLEPAAPWKQLPLQRKHHRAWSGQAFPRPPDSSLVGPSGGPAHPEAAVRDVGAKEVRDRTGAAGEKAWAIRSRCTGGIVGFDYSGPKTPSAPGVGPMRWNLHPRSGPFWLANLPRWHAPSGQNHSGDAWLTMAFPSSAVARGVLGSLGAKPKLRSLSLMEPKRAEGRRPWGGWQRCPAQARGPGRRTDHDRITDGW